MSPRTLLAALVAAAEVPVASPRDPSDPLPALRDALGWQSARGSRAARVEARVRYLGGDGRAVIVAAPEGDLLFEIASPLPEVAWVRGGRGTASDWNGMPHPLEGHDLEVARLLASVLTGAWLAEESIVRVGSAPAQAGVPSSLPVSVRGGRLEARLTLDPQGRPAVFEIQTLRGAERLALEYGIAPVPWVPTRVRHTLGEIPIAEYERAAIGHGAAEALGLRPPDLSIPRDVSFDRGSPEVRAMRAKSGHLLVEVEMDGIAGWFILDSGASATVVSPGWPRAGLARVGEAPLVSAYGIASSPVRRASTLRVGPALIRNLPVIEMDLRFLAEPLGQPVQGILGYDLFARAVARIEPASARVELEPPDASRLSEPWIPMRFEGKLPVVEGRWDVDRSGSFRIDLGAGPAVIFHWSAVERYRLLEGRTGRRIPVGEDTLVMDSIAWFELGGVRTPAVTAFFAEKPASGILRDRYTDGNVGLGLLDRYRIVLDYRRSRLALLPRGGAAAPSP